MLNSGKQRLYRDIHGVLEAIQPLERIEIKTKIGSLVPVYKVEDHGRMKLVPIKVDSTGKIKSFQLQEPTEIATSVGSITCEFVTFYESGAIKRVFPLNGKLSGYWSQENEYKLAKLISIPTPLGNIRVKPIYLHFYETGEIKSITFWPGEIVELPTPSGIINIKTGISFYKNGSLKSYEPNEIIEIETSIGVIEAFDPDPMGINGEKNSLSFTESGNVLTLSTVSKEIDVIKDGAKHRYSPLKQLSRCSDSVYVTLPLNIEFNGESVIFKHINKVIGIEPLTAWFTVMDYSWSSHPQLQSCS
ncbi:MAG: hypothetical protein JXR64_04325 [Spirochaetales bacterium]|nr:hypothetical protein [Spirochaetales bacterium]